MDEWEYNIITEPQNLSVPALLHHLNEMGKGGWELVFVMGLAFIFKRRKSRLVI